ncbi:MAG: MFS transporter [Gammaproteobacteria bacterium]|nr:MFS transporter [Gammaproteobacteria bacterium]
MTGDAGQGGSRKATGVRWRVLAVLMVASFISYVLRYNVSTAGPAMMADLDLNEIEFGWVLAAFTAGYAIFQFPGGLFGNAAGLRRAFTLIAVLWAVLTLLTSAVPAAAVLLPLIAVRFLVGASHAPIYPLTTGVIERWFPIGGWALPQGLSSTALTLGVAVSTPAVVWAVGAYGWRPVFLAIAPLGFLTAWACWAVLRDDPAAHPAVNRAEVDLIAANRPAAVDSAERTPAWLRVLKNRDVLFLTASYFCANYVFYHFFNWVFYYFVEIRGYDEQYAGYLTSIQWVAAAVGATLGGFVCDYLTRRFGLARACRWMSIGGLALSGAAMGLASTPVGPVVLGTCLAVSFLAMQATEASHWAAAIGVGGRHAGPAGGVMNTGGNAVGSVNALLVPVIAAWLGWSAAMATTSVFALVGAVLWLFIRPDRRMPD